VTAPDVSVVVLAYGAEQYLRECVEAILGQEGVCLELVLVDNGTEAERIQQLPRDPRIRVVSPGSNLGFAGGCNEAVRHTRAETLVFVNSDAIIAADAIQRLTDALADPEVGLASGGIRLAADPRSMNSVGNPVQFLGFVWAAGYGDAAAAHTQPTDVTSASGAFLAITRRRWDSLGGFPEDFFAYHEDTDLSLRAWQRGWRVRFVPDAVAYHHYEFSRNPLKQYLVERNRWLTVLTVYPSSLLGFVLPAMLAFEVPLCAVAIFQGWLPAKLRGWWWLLGHRRQIAERRREVQSASVMSPTDFARLLSARIEPAMVGRPPGLELVNKALTMYWRLACRRLGLR
jgi:GT2 family glycosyltransferase